MRKERCNISERIDSFVSRTDAGMLTGERRMGTECLLDMLADRLAGDEHTNVIRVKGKDDVPSVRSKIVTDKNNHILLYFADPGVSEMILQEFPEACVYGAKELCHQVPVCFREPVSMTERVDRCSF